MAPVVAITYPADNATVSSSNLTVSGTASDGGRGDNGVSVTVNGANAIGGTASGSGTASWSGTVTLNSGANTITVVAKDSLNNPVTSTISVTYTPPDSTPPALNIASPANNATVSSPNLTVSGTASDSGRGNNGVASVTVNGVNAIGGTASGSGEASWSGTVALNSGANTITVVARDSLNNPAQQQITVNYVPAALPNLILYQPNGWSDKLVVSKEIGTTTDSSSLYTTDNLYVDWVYINNGSGPTLDQFVFILYMDGVQQQTWRSSTLQSGDGGTVSDFHIINPGAGQHEIKIVLDSFSEIAESDETDNEYTKTITIVEPPSCAWSIAPMSANYPASGGNGSITVTLTSGADCTRSAVPGQPWISITSGGTSSLGGVVNYSVEANAGLSRTGTITIAGQTFTIAQAAYLAVCSATRSVTGTTISLAVTPPAGTSAWGLEETIPVGLTVSGITAPNGNWNASTRKVSWYSTGASSVSVGYTVGGATGTYTLVGWASMDGSDSPVCGATNVAIGGCPPADVNNNWNMVMSEAITHLACWQNGNCQMSYAIRAATLWQNGPAYHRIDGTAEPLCWVPGALALSVPEPMAKMSARSGVSVIAAGAVRTVSGTNVILAITPPAGTTAWGFEESIPEGLTPSSVTGPNGNWNVGSRKITWYATGSSTSALSYAVTGADGSYALAGVVNFDGADGSTLGDTQVVVGAAPACEATRAIAGTAVSIGIAPAAGTSAWGFEETLPVGITPAGMTGPNGNWNAANRRITWYSTGSAGATLGYTAAGAAGAYTVTGVVNLDGRDGLTCGETQLVISLQEVVSTPVLAGPSSGLTNHAMTFTASGATNNAGHAVEYRLGWGDGALSGWGGGVTSHAWASAGTYSVTAQARCVSGHATSDWSAVRTVTITNTPVQPLNPPLVSITNPVADRWYNAPATVEINVAAQSQNPGGSITQVIFYANGLEQARDTIPPFAVSLGSVANGHYQLTAGAYDSLGSSALSSSVHVFVNANPVAVDDVASASSYTSIVIAVLANDFDVDGDALTILSANDPPHGVIGVAQTYLLYTPDAGYAGSDSFIYTISDGHGGTANAQVTVTVAVPGYVQWSTNTIQIYENAGSVALVATRTGGSAGAASVQYGMSNGTAVAGSDYLVTNAQGTLTWAAGDGGAKTVMVAVVDDVLPEENEIFTINLLNAAGASLGSPVQQVITILANDFQYFSESQSAIGYAKKDWSFMTAWNLASGAFLVGPDWYNKSSTFIYSLPERQWVAVFLYDDGTAQTRELRWSFRQPHVQ